MSDAGLILDESWNVSNTNETELPQYPGDISSLPRDGKDVITTQSMPEDFELEDRLGLPANPGTVSNLRSGMIHPKPPSPPKVHHQSLISCTKKLETMQDFDELDVKEPIKP